MYDEDREAYCVCAYHTERGHEAEQRSIKPISKADWNGHESK